MTITADEVCPPTAVGVVMFGAVAMGDSIDWTKLRKDYRLPIGTVGSTGKSTGPHLHFEVPRRGRLKPPEPPQDPEQPTEDG